MLLSPRNALSYVIGCQTSREVWERLERRFSSTNRLNVVGLKTELQSVVKQSEENVDSYFQRINAIVNKLAAVSIDVEQEDLVIYTVNGLPTAYDMFKTSLRTRSSPVTFEELHILLRNEEKTINKNSVLDVSNVVSSLAMTANFEGNNRSNWRPQKINRGNSNYRSNNGSRGVRGRGNFVSNSSSNHYRGQFFEFTYR